MFKCLKNLKFDVAADINKHLYILPSPSYVLYSLHTFLMDGTSQSWLATYYEIWKRPCVLYPWNNRMAIFSKNIFP